MFITEEDYKVVVGAASLNVIAQSDPRNLDRAEVEAIEEVSGYLRPRYDVKAIFSAVGEMRNSQIVMYTCDVALYHLCASINQKMGMEIRKERYDRAIKWLEDVSKGKILPNLPIALDQSGEPEEHIHYGSERLHKHTW